MVVILVLVFSVFVKFLGIYRSPRSRSELAPGSGFHPRDKSTKIYCVFWGPGWFNKKIDPEI